MNITFDPAKRDKTLLERGLDFADACDVFAGKVIEREDTRADYGGIRMITIGFLRGRMVLVGWTQRSETYHVFTMRKCNGREQKAYGAYFESLPND